MADEESELTSEQVRLLDAWYPERQMVANLSWGLVGTHVLQIVADSQPVIVKAADAKDYHLAREIRAHREWLTPWTSIGRAPELLHADESARIIATRYLPGRLVQGSDAEYRADTYRQAGALLALLHAQSSIIDAGYPQVLRDETLRTLDRPHRLDAGTARRARELVEQWPDTAVSLVPTHGDWQPRNWLDDEGIVPAIDFGRAALRPALTDFVRLASRQFRIDAAFEQAFVEGYGVDPREPAAWQREQLREAIGTLVWAFGVGDEAFEMEGRRSLDELLATAQR